MKYKFLILLVLIISSCKEVTKPGSEAEKQVPKKEATCTCSNYNEQIKLVKIKGRELLVCGLLDKYANPLNDQYGLVSVYDCKVNKTISKVDESLSFKVSTKLDTLVLKCYSDFPVGVNYSKKVVCFFENVYYLENNTIVSKYRYPSDFPYYNQNQLEEVKKIYENFKQDQIAISPSEEQSKINQFMGQLFVAALSGDDEAKNRLFNFENYYGTVLGAHDEILSEYVFLFNQAKGL